MPIIGAREIWILYFRFGMSGTKKRRKRRVAAMEAVHHAFAGMDGGIGMTFFSPSHHREPGTNPGHDDDHGRAPQL
ncbi:hypothetical protein LKL35_17570 [Streptomyces sp. ET3-23]|uniref:hypothetical protein n=1 Tax=Streptomyces sp. ET3-23 TaxID=2885643 RepID=UPI001D11241F|nr:hypothetical protein [Streptomyces sp. ET3-23]MCC2277213.1 hypothetical protein [Streptomyces sp. ET3-23]